MSDKTHEQVKQELQVKYLRHLPTVVTDDVFREAYERGHSCGWHEVEQEYENLAALVTKTLGLGANVGVMVGVLQEYMDLSESYNAIDDAVTRYQAEEVSAERTLSDIAAIIADHESGDEV